ncbi:hypothetical protein GBA52_003637 [Prunus armeniaca]|nr:hypothetical protein GBA52_003637 [Prunus armeniaca]
MFMQGRRSQNSAVVVYNPEIERTLRRLRKQKLNTQREDFEKGERLESVNEMGDEQVAQPNTDQKKNNLEGAILQFLTAQQQTNALTSQNIQKLEATTSQAIQRLEAQVGQLAKELSERKKGEFPSQTIPNPGGQEQLKDVTVLRSGKVVDNKVGTDEKEKENVEPPPATKVSEKEKVILPPFPQSLFFSTDASVIKRRQQNTRKKEEGRSGKKKKEEGRRRKGGTICICCSPGFFFLF